MKIDKNIPIPEDLGIRGKKKLYPLAEMEVGDSILVDGTSASSSGCGAYNAALQHGRHFGKKFSGRKEGQDKVRIWRVE